LTTPFAGEYAIHAAVSPTADRVAYYQTLVSDAGLYTAIALRVVVVDGGAEIPYRKFPVGFTALGTIDAGPLPVVAAAWDPVIGDFGWVENSDAGQRIVEGVAATPFCPEGTISIPGTPVLAVGFGKSASLQYALVESAIPDAGVHTTWIERACGDPEQPFPTSAGSYGDFAISPDGTLAVLVGPPGSDAGPILDAAAGSALWVATTSPVSGHFATTLCREPGDASGVASPAWVDSKHIVWNEGATSGPNFSPIDPSRSWVDLNLGNEPFTIMIADWSDAGCTNVRSVRTPTQGPAGTAMLPASSDSLTALLLQAVTCSVTEPGLGGRSSGLAVAGILVVAGALFRRRREGDQGSHEP
jgi:MYXO-CTERM domain-containing protein